LNPAFSEKSVTLWVNIVIAVFFSIGLFVISLVVLTEGGQMSEPAGGLPGVFLLQGIVCWVVGVIVLRLGRERFSRIE
jgi:ABC-type branched-subunit amino acid transport system permease subunit